MSASTPNRFRLTLEKLAAEPPSTKTALVRLLLPAIEAAFASGKTWKDVWQCLADDGLKMSYETFRKVLSRARKTRTVRGPNGVRRTSASESGTREFRCSLLDVN